MKNSVRLLFMVITITIAFFHDVSWSWNDEVTHRDLTDYATNYSVLGPNEDYLNRIGFKTGLGELLPGAANGFPWPSTVCDDKTKQTICTIKDWLKYGAEKEDASKYLPVVEASVRSLNHFHEPISNMGLHDSAQGESAQEWAQDAAAQSRVVQGDQSWSAARQLYYDALTAPEETVRKQTFAMLFKGLGHQMHLVQDMAVPYHVRNDAHASDALQGEEWYNPLHWMARNTPLYFETWAKNNRDIINGLAAAPYFPADNVSCPDEHARGLITDLWDLQVYNGTNPSASADQGLAEYTNANFFSEDTVFAAENKAPGDPHYFPYPKLTSTDISQVVAKSLMNPNGTFYLSKIGDGETINNFARMGYLGTQVLLLNGSYIPDCYLDEEVHRSYAAKLVPRAVGYSAALLNYFFRGIVELVPDEEEGHGYVIENKTEDEMVGTFEIYYDNKQCVRQSLWSGSFDLGTQSSGNNKSGPIEFEHPNDAQEPGKYIIVFSGRLGNEENAVVGGISVLEEGAFVYVSIGGNCAVWDTSRNNYAIIRDEAGNAISFPCDCSLLNKWLIKHPSANASEIEWDFSPFYKYTESLPESNPEPGIACQPGVNCSGMPSYKVPYEVDGCIASPGLPGYEDCGYAYKDAQCCAAGEGPTQHCTPNSENPTWFKSTWYREERGRNCIQAYSPENDLQTPLKYSMFGSYIGRFNGYEGYITNQVDLQSSLSSIGGGKTTYNCSDWEADYRTDMHWEQFYYSEFNTFLGVLGEITYINGVKTHVETNTDTEILYFQQRQIDTASHVDRYKIGLVSDHSVVFLFLYQYRMAAYHPNITYTYEKPELFVQAVAANFENARTINPFSIPLNNKFTKAIKDLVSEYYHAAGALENEILQLDNSILIDIKL
ncbi:MAG: hypothetical protein M0036_12320 [Desulfobacteraceae bacterium]|nr:hypothetical protein [Desulfobacteraceae bacterium]